MKKIFFKILLALIFFSCNSIYPIDLGSGYKLDIDGNSYIDFQDSQNDIIINSHIMNYSFDSTYIIIEQKPRGIILNNIYNTDPKATFDKISKKFEESPIRQYWIINKREKCKYTYDSIKEVGIYSNVYGPYRKEQYIQEIKELSVPQQLKLKQ